MVSGLPKSRKETNFKSASFNSIQRSQRYKLNKLDEKEGRDGAGERGRKRDEGETGREREREKTSLRVKPEKDSVPLSFCFCPKNRNSEYFLRVSNPGSGTDTE